MQQECLEAKETWLVILCQINRQQTITAVPFRETKENLETVGQVARKSPIIDNSQLQL